MSSKHPNEMSRHSGITKVHKHTPSGISNSLQTLWAKKQKAQEGMSNSSSLGRDENRLSQDENRLVGDEEPSQA